MRQMYAILVSVENEGDFITTFRKDSKKGISCKFLSDFEGNKRKKFKIMKRRPKSRKDAENMISLPLKFDEVESVEEFVNMVKRLDYDVDVKIGRCVFDAKSLMSVLMIAGNPDAVVEAHTNDIEAFKKKFKDYLQ